MKKIAIAGGTGFIGRYLASRFRDDGFRVIIISRTGGDITWNDSSAITDALNGSDMIINLAGKSVDCRYNEKNKQEILSSRVETTKAIGNALQNCSRPPALWINASTATIYRHAEDRPMTEDKGELGNGFSVNVARKWEQTFFDFNIPGTRQIALRMAIVLGGHGGVMQPLNRLARFGLGGSQGNGNQMFSWLHIEDLYNIIIYIMEHDELSGVVNCSSPQPVTNKKLMEEIRKSLHIKFGLSAPKWLLKIGAILIRTETELILKSRWVLPERLLNSGFKFKYPELHMALKNIQADVN